MSKTSHIRHEHKHAKKQSKMSVINSSTAEKSYDYHPHAGGDILIVILIVGLGIFFILPYFFLMPSGLAMALLVIFALTISVFTALVWRSKPKNEREAHHNSSIGQLTFLVAVVALAVAILVQSLRHSLDPWLVWILIILVVVRVGYKLYLHYNVK